MGSSRVQFHAYQEKTKNCLENNLRAETRSKE